MKYFLKGALFILLALLTAEGILRIQEQLLETSEKYKSLVMRKYVNHIFWVMVNPAKVDFFQPPNITFTNTNFQSDERLQDIFEKTLGPVGTSEMVTDVLVPDSQEKFRTSLNNAGFRGIERNEVKAKGTKRVFVLGSYHAFGVGVNDTETYAARLEEDLGPSVEVWNAGRMSSSAIVGLAHLKNNILKRSPDLVILDYGFVDATMVDESSENIVDQERNRAFYLGPFESSYLLHQFRYKILNPEPGSVKGFTNVMNEMIRILNLNKIPVVVVRQNYHFNIFDPWFSQAEKSGIPVVRVGQAFAKNVPSQEDWEKTHWLDDVPREWRRKIPLFRFAPYYKNPFHLSAAGHKALADEIKYVIQEKGLLK